MLLKIQRYDEKQSFWLLDNIRKISVSENIHLNTVSKKGSNPTHDITILDMLQKNTCNCDGITTGCSDCKYAKELICRLTDGSEFSVLFDTTAYILNDNGKTIEKIVANYND